MLGHMPVHLATGHCVQNPQWICLIVALLPAFRVPPVFGENIFFLVPFLEVPFARLSVQKKRAKKKENMQYTRLSTEDDDVDTEREDKAADNGGPSLDDILDGLTSTISMGLMQGSSPIDLSIRWVGLPGYCIV